MADKQSSEKMMEEMAKARGYAYPEWELSTKLDPEFIEAYNKLAAIVFLHEGVVAPRKVHLAAKYREMVAIGVLCFRGRERGVETHMRRAMRMGATKEEIFEAMQAIVLPGGSPAYSLGVQTLMKILKEQGQA